VLHAADRWANEGSGHSPAASSEVAAPGNEANAKKTHRTLSSSPSGSGERTPNVETLLPTVTSQYIADVVQPSHDRRDCRGAASNELHAAWRRRRIYAAVCASQRKPAFTYPSSVAVWNATVG
jgi:hypothetical protein